MEMTTPARYSGSEGLLTFPDRILNSTLVNGKPSGIEDG